jgi:hypothetical protein
MQAMVFEERSSQQHSPNDYPSKPEFIFGLTYSTGFGFSSEKNTCEAPKRPVLN